MEPPTVTKSRTRSRFDALLPIALGAVIFVSLGLPVALSYSACQVDFKEVYYGARCALQGHDPYRPGAPLDLYLADGGKFPLDPGVANGLRRVIAEPTYPPSALLTVAPLAALPWKTADALWMGITVAFLLIASLSVWQAASETAPWLSGCLIGLLVANSEVLVWGGNPAGPVVGLTVIAVCCFLQQRFIPAGILCLAVALAFKPQDAGLIWLYFLLAGAAQRKRALQSLAITAVIASAAILWMSHVAPHWWPELHANVVRDFSAQGNSNPGPETPGSRGFGMVITLQAVFAHIHDDPRFYNFCTYAVCAVPLILWFVKTIRTTFSARSAWLALASISALSMLPVYHRSHDARLLLLAAPACAMLWKEGGALRWVAPILTASGILATGDLFWAEVWAHTHFSPGSLNAAVFIAPLILFATGIFYLCLYLRCDAREHKPAALNPRPYSAVVQQ